ncbi:7,8-didemethyl-8-hydroxy-5-deazariboflavin synthase subunit CofG, partial [Methanosarcinales archaeon]
ELKYLKPYNGSMGLMLETTADLPAHAKSPSKDPKKRLRVIRYAGSLRIPFTTGILVGIGESWDDRIESLSKIAELHERYGHIQEVIIQGFSPKKGTAMENHPCPSPTELLECVRIAREQLPEDVVVQIPPNLVPMEMLPEFIKAGASDVGGISEITPDYINPEAPWPSVSELRRAVGSVRERLCIHPKYVLLGWYGKKVEHLVKELAGEDGLVAQSF